LISRQKQIQNLRTYIAKEIEEIRLKSTLINRLKYNKQDVTGSLVNSILAINYNKSGKYLNIKSSFNKQAGLLEDIRVSVELPWGEYGRKLDTVEGRASNAKGKRMSPDKNKIFQWMDAKGLFKSGFYRQKKTLKNGATRTYVYSSKRDSYRKGIAFRIARKIQRENEIKTRFAYSTELNIKIELAVLRGFEKFFDDFALQYFEEYTLELGKSL